MSLGPQGQRNPRHTFKYLRKLQGVRHRLHIDTRLSTAHLNYTSHVSAKGSICLSPYLEKFLVFTFCSSILEMQAVNRLEDQTKADFLSSARPSSCPQLPTQHCFSLDFPPSSGVWKDLWINLFANAKYIFPNLTCSVIGTFQSTAGFTLAHANLEQKEYGIILN